MEGLDLLGLGGGHLITNQKVRGSNPLGPPSNQRLSLAPKKKPNALLATARENVWFAVDCAGGGPGAMVTPNNCQL